MSDLPKNKDFNPLLIFFYTSFLFFILMLLINSVYIIKTGQIGILLTTGKVSENYIADGIHIKVPFYQSIIKMDIQTQKYEADLTSASKDLQDVKSKIAINYYIKKENVVELYSKVGLDFANKIIYPIEQETNKAVTSRYTASELITKRNEVREEMKTQLYEKLINRGIIIEEVSIINFEFSESFSKAIENKVVAQQLKEKAENDLERIKVEAEQKIASANAEAESLRLQKSQITPEMIELRKIEMQREAIEKWNGVMPQVTGGVPFINFETTQKLNNNVNKT